MTAVPKKDRAWLRANKQVFRGASGRSVWMTTTALRKAVRAGKANHWSVVNIDFETGESSENMCPCCAAGLDCLAWRAAGNGWQPRMPKANAKPVSIPLAAFEASGRLH